jgi:ribosomal protein S18 acetylase RimI-like enzyme
MKTDEITRIGEVNRSEITETEHIIKSDGSGFGLVATRIESSPPTVVPPWGKRGTVIRIQNWVPALGRGGFLYGAFDAERLVGFIILGPKGKDGSGEIVALFVDQDHRRMGIGGTLMTWAEGKARALGMESLFLYSNPTGSSVGFYLNAGFEIVGLISKEVVESLPGDIIMAKKLNKA